MPKNRGLGLADKTSKLKQCVQASEPSLDIFIWRIMTDDENILERVFHCSGPSNTRTGLEGVMQG